MKHILVFEIWRLVAVLFISFLVGVILDNLTIAWITGLLLFLLWHFRQLKKLDNWIDSNLSHPPELSGIWEDLAYRIYHKRKRSEARKKRTSELLRRFQKFTNALPDAAVALDSKGEILWFSPRATEMLGLSPKDIGRTISNLIRHPEFVQFFNQRDYKAHLELPSPSDDSRILDIRLTQYSVDDLLLLVRDITQIQHLKTMRRDFVANVSHELRTPLTVIQGYLEAIEDIKSFDQETLMDVMAKLRGTSERMKSIVEDLLLLSKLDTAGPPMVDVSQKVDVKSLIDSILIEVEQISKNKHDINYELDPNLKLLGIAKELHSVVSNLINNALRHTPEGGRIEVRWYQEGKYAYLVVQDSGVGIAQEHISRLTERFYRVDVGRSRATGGTGLGLAIVKQILRRHDAELQIASELGSGSVFTCRFPESRITINGKVDKISNFK